MQIVLVGAGVACLIAAVAGVGIKALNVEIGAITNRGRQALLAVLGAAFLAAGFFAGSGGEDASPRVDTSPKVTSRPATLPASDRRLTPASVSATSTLPPVPGITYRAENLLDDDNTTAWCEGARGNGIGESLTFAFAVPVRLRRIDVINGYNKGGSNQVAYLANARAENVGIGSSDGSRLATLRDTRGVQHLPVPNSATTFVRLTIKSVYGGSRYEDLCLTDFQFIGTGA
ncbi:MAG: discoidin domain-containing protein [Gaiellaceae bacterium]